MILNSPYVSGSLTVTGNITALGGISISGSIASASYAANAELLDGLDSSVFVLSSSFQNYSSSNDGKVAALNTFSASILSYTSSTDDKIAQLNRETASLNLATASINNATASLYAATASIYNFTSSANLRIGSLEQYTQSLNTRSASFACVTATNNFGCAQYFSNASNAISFSSTGSLYSDGGMRITKDMYVSGTAFFNNVTVFGTQSINYITSSQLNIASNLITVNTSTPAVRFGGLAVYDSGSLGTGLTGSILWDSENNHWVYSNPSGSSYSGGMFISGPRSAALGSEQGTTACMLMMGQGGDHITSSAIYHSSTITCIGNSKIAGNLNVAGNSCLGEGNLFISTDSTFDTRASYTFRDAAGINNPNGLSYCAADTVLSVGSRSNGNSIITTGNIGIGTACPTVQLQVIGTIAAGDSTNGWGRLSFNTNEVRLQASKDGIDPIGISFWTQASGGTFAERMRIACDGKVGIGTTTPSAELQINKNCDAVIAISSCVGVTTGNRGALAFYNCATSTVALIRAGAVTDNVGTELQFHTRPAGGSLTQVLTLGNTGVACFACQVCAPSATFCQVGTVLQVLQTGATNQSTAIIRQTTAGGNGNQDIGLIVDIQGANDQDRIANFRYYDGTNYNSRFIIQRGGIACFANTVCMATLISNNSSGFAACITSCSTDYSMYVRNMSSGFPLSIYTNGDSNGVNDDLKALKIARASNDNQFLAVSLIYGGFGYGYKFAPRYYNGAAYVCGAPTVIDSYGNIGINCTAPFMPLTVKGCAGIDKLVVNGTCFNSFGEHLQINGCARLFYGQFRVSSGPNDSNYVFLTHDDVNGYLCINRTVYAGNMILAPFGGVGINTSVVSSKLTVNSGINTSSANVLTLQQATNGANKDAAAFGLSIQNGGESTNAADLYISTATGGALCERMRITSGGNIGLGATSLCSTYTVTIEGYGSNSSTQLYLKRQGIDQGLFITAGGGTTTYNSYDGNNIVFGRHQFQSTKGTTSCTRFYIDENGLNCFACLVYAPVFCQPAGFTVYSFPINYGVSFCDVSSGNYLSVGGTEPGTINSYCAYAHGGISPRAVAANTEGMSWTCLRFVLRVLSPVGDTVGTPTYLQTAGYFYTVGWYGLGTCTNIAGVMDGSRGYSTVVLPWIPFSSFTGAGDVTGFGIRNVGPTTTRIGSVFIQYK